MDTIGALTLPSIGSKKATDALYQTLSSSAKAIENLTKGDMMWPHGEVKLSSDQVLDSVDVAEACGEVDGTREMESTIKTEVLAELKDRTR